MNAKTRYRHRRRFQSALTHALEVSADNHALGIDPDPTTALLAWEVVKKLVLFIHAAGLNADQLPTQTNLSRAVDLIQSRKRETQARRRRSRGHR